MTDRQPWATEDLRAMVDQLKKPPYHPFLIDRVRAAMNYAADVMDAAEKAISPVSRSLENRE